MVEYDNHVSAIFHALAHEARRDMLRRLTAGELTIGELAQPLSMSLAAASKHIRVLEHTGLVHRTVSGRRHVCRLDPAPLAAARDWLAFYDSFRGGHPNALDAMFAQATKGGEV